MTTDQQPEPNQPFGRDLPLADRIRNGAREGVVILVLALCSFLTLALLSFDANDGGWSSSQSAGLPENLMGRFGAYCSDLLLSLVGYSAYLLPLVLLYYAFHRLYLGRQPLDGAALALRFFGFLVWICANATLASLHFYHPDSPLPSAAGGIVGEAFTALFLGSLGLMGATLMMLALWMIGFSLLTGWSWLQITDALGYYAEQGGLRLADWVRQEAKESSAGLPEHYAVRDTPQAVAPRRDSDEAAAEDAGDWDFSRQIAAYSAGKPLDELSASSSPAPEISSEDNAASAEEAEQQSDTGSLWQRLKQRLPQLPPLMSAKTAVSRTPPAAPDRRIEPELNLPSLTAIDDEPDLGSLQPSQAVPQSRVPQSAAEPEHMPPQPHAVQPAAQVSSELQQAFSAPAPEAVTATDAGTFGDSAVESQMPHPAHTFTASPEQASADTAVPAPDAPSVPVRSEPEVAESRSEPTREERLAAVTQTTEEGEIWSVARFQKPDTTPVGEITGTRPSVDLLTQGDTHTRPSYTPEQLQSMSELLEVRLKEFNVVAQVVDVHPGPVITRFEIQPAAGVKASKITNLATDLARALAVTSVRVVEVIAGKSSVGIEIPNQNRAMIRLHKMLSHPVYTQSDSPLTLALGDDIAGQPVVANLAKMPHLLVAGTTGSGKSVGVNAMLISMLLKATPEELRLIMVDPKMLELSVYDGIPHLLTPVVTDMKDAANALRWCVAEMERRYKLMAAMGVRNIAGFNSKLDEAAAQGARVADPTAKPVQGEAPPTLEKLPFIVVVIDEFADMMMIVGKKVEELIARLAQKARAAGIHLVLATQRPSVDVITGLIKANIPTRIAFQVSSKIDSRTILDQGGAEQLLGHGDMLYLPPGTAMPVRVHGAFVDDDEVHRVVENWKRRGAPDYVDSILNGWEENGVSSEGGSDAGDEDRDALYDQVVEFITETRRVSASGIQRRFKIGYNRAARLVESLEAAGVVSPMGSNGQREVLAPPAPGQE